MNCKEWSAGEAKWVVAEDGGMGERRPDVPAPDEYARVVDTLGKPELEDLCLEAAFEEILQLEAQHVVEPHLALVEHPDAHQATQERIPCTPTFIRLR